MLATQSLRRRDKRIGAHGSDYVTDRIGRIAGHGIVARISRVEPVVPVLETVMMMTEWSEELYKTAVKRAVKRMDSESGRRDFSWPH